jgi:hypothetical protein
MSDPGDQDKTFMATLGGVVVTSLPVVSTVVFFAVTIKVFRVANMETATTVAVVSQADVIQLLKGVVLTLLPGFLASIVAACIWWWAADIPRPAAGHAGREQVDPEAASRAVSLTCPRFVLVLAALAISFFTLPWSVLLVFLVPVLAAVVVLVAQSHGRALSVRGVRPALRAASLLMSFAMIGSLALSPTVWLPVRSIEFREGTVAQLHEMTVSGEVAGYILDSTEERTSILLHDPRAVVTVPTEGLVPNAPLCVFPPSPMRWVFLRASQVLGLDPDFGSPYPRCPQSEREEPASGAP